MSHTAGHDGQMQLPGISGKRVLITGGSSGIGLATAQTFAKMGAKVCIVGRRCDEPYTRVLAKAFQVLAGSAVRWGS
jgi:NAD(P)-dependent dehydrogenase (short-subunit alcohol dehydrogenase family)